jgi:predicted branched-subunit amino acid permease
MKHEKIATFKFAVQKSLPVLFGYLFLGSAFGIMLYKAGYNWIWAVFISIFDLP